ncbi:hypothetical protein G6F46_011102 [Rhizopus delemar]|nr:hypothetical protein G6F36_013026 [Rhizopus arrhizus]KAG1448884.1 hypothetical protein G6F55_010429 [Rhizopus delemar]KAG1490437.1 hypothetical protein G6F54_010722 [Rhizopus delemar]KAG1502336.1 hypothetical protein G6F53_010877 [Rhizopus delemar]KAG1519460.1 hypothetical protein G6F52_008600 [Rhizopus delemar]
MDWGAVRAAAWLIIHFQFQGLSELLICILLIPTDQSINTSKKNNGHVYFRLDKFGASNAGMGILLNTSLFIVKYPPVSKWDFESLKNMEHCYSNSSRNKNHKSETNYYNYGSVGFQGEINGTISINPSKRALEETEEDRAELSKTHQNCHSDTTDESFKVTGPSSNYGELFKQRRYILELNEFDDISLKSKVSVHSKDNELSLDERLLLSSINYYDNCPVELLLQPCAFSDQTYTEIRKWRQSRVTKTEYFPSHLAPNDPPTEKDIFREIWEYF